MALTHDQIQDLNNSMEAARQVQLGHIVNYLSGSLSASSAFVPAAAVTSVLTGLGAVGYAIAELSGSISATHNFVTVTAGSGAGRILINAWLLSGSVLSAATTPFTMVTWRAYGT